MNSFQRKSWVQLFLYTTMQGFSCWVKILSQFTQFCFYAKSRVFQSGGKILWEDSIISHSPQMLVGRVKLHSSSCSNYTSYWLNTNINLKHHVLLSIIFEHQNARAKSNNKRKTKQNKIVKVVSYSFVDGSKFLIIAKRFVAYTSGGGNSKKLPTRCKSSPSWAAGQALNATLL